MAKFATHGVLSVSTGVLMGDIGEVYKVMSFLLGRDAFTHELAYYRRAGERALKAAHGELPTRQDFSHVTGENHAAVLAEWETRLGGKAFELDDSLRDVLADNEDATSTLKTMAPNTEVITIISRDP